jgi:NAD(P)-dependent dehydrogenase (short-subunit alcohol dehydrogenase family)
VVVNDLGTSPDGEGSDAGPAEEVVGLIRAAGGKAVVNGASIADPAGAASIIEDAIKNFGKIDGLVNNAGILRDRIFHRMSIQDWNDVVNVTLNGYFYTSKAAAGYFKDQGSGSYVHFTSTSGLVGNFGQANYSAAKMGVVGLSNSIALDMQRSGVRSNCISPYAWSRLIATIPTESEEELARVERMKTMSADKIAPMVAALLSDAAKDITGQIFAVRKNEISLFVMPRPIRTIHRSEGWTPETIASDLIPAMSPHMPKLARSADMFPYDPI